MIGETSRFSYQVSWQLRRAQPWQSACFGDRNEAMACFFRWMTRGVAVRWASLRQSDQTPGTSPAAGEIVYFAPRQAVRQ